jgi:formylglycine-generating enzyme
MNVSARVIGWRAPRRALRLVAGILAVTGLWLSGCRKASAPGEPNATGTASAADTSSIAAPSASEVKPPPWKTENRAPPASKGMVWIPGGALFSGTPPDRLPRKADEEMKGEQVVLDGFYIDEYAYPNEQGAIPRTGVTYQQAETACAERGKRLCSELEWERACKGPRNLTYEYGDRYQPATCGTGSPIRALPSGYRFSCRSEFGVHDLHGSLWEWTSSPWGRGQGDARVTTRGGNGPDGELVGRCANAQGQYPSQKNAETGFRCCSGPRNEAEVELNLDEGPALRLQMRPDRVLLRGLESKLPRAEAEEMRRRGLFRFDRVWEWKPIANEDLLIAGGCAGATAFRRCGVLVVRRTLGQMDVLEWVPSGMFTPAVRAKRDPERVYIYGGDKRSHFRTPIEFVWGKLRVEAQDRSREQD